jgi:uncharacterized membrane protein
VIDASKPLLATGMGVAVACGVVAVATRSRTIATVSGIAGTATLGLTALALLSARGRAPEPIEVSRAITVQRSATEIYGFWRKLHNLPRAFQHITSVVALDELRSRWVLEGPAGLRVDWTAEIVEDIPGSVIGWRSLPGSDIGHEGRLQLISAPGARGTEVRVHMKWTPPVGRVGAAVAKLLGAAPELLMSADLRRLKQILETGDVMRSDASIHRGMHPARPPGRVVPRLQGAQR